MPAKTPPNQIAVFSTKLGWMIVCGRDDVLCGLQFGAASEGTAVARLREEYGDLPELNDWNTDLVVRLQRFAAGEFDDFCDVTVDTTDLSEFSRRVVSQCRQIPPGETLTYGELAARAGSAAAARAVGRVMARNRIPLVIPCHRVVGSGGKLTGFSAPGGCETKQRLLELEMQMRPVAVA
ncbi:MAG: methylated-DNA--[protein]-cysteine S-methyltransferase [Planctomycetota bacterium]|nr:MAG: methylated-DNA--[protein]-cysteine S-methyltransferase [Planctomycetota bacterium]REK40797.1 MAG: methylated-DNA--[protein]-cysteine S-methyltransferase [Planctomycetota bacterium]